MGIRHECKREARAKEEESGPKTVGIMIGAKKLSEGNWMKTDELTSKLAARERKSEGEA
jgi:hypothetical protein